MKLIKSAEQAGTAGKVITLANDASPLELLLDGVDCIELQFPKFTDGRAYSQAFLLRRRLGGYTGDGLGATQQVTEVAALLALALALGAAP